MALCFFIDLYENLQAPRALVSGSATFTNILNVLYYFEKKTKFRIFRYCQFD